MSPLTPLHANSDLPPSTNGNFLVQIWPHRDVLATHLFNRGILLTLEDLNTKLFPNCLPQGTYMQMRHFLSMNDSIQHLIKDMSILEELC